MSAEGGLPEKLPVPYGANAAISADGEWLAYTPHSHDGRTWKRYRGGMATDIWLFNLNNHTSKKITDWEGTDSQPMWHGAKVYYMSDAGTTHRLNIWVYDTGTGETRQVTKYADYDIKWPAIGPGSNGQGEIVFQHASDVYLLDLETEKAQPVSITIPGDRPKVRVQPVRRERADLLARHLVDGEARRRRGPGRHLDASRQERGSAQSDADERRARSVRRRGARTASGSRTSPTRPGSTSSTSPSPTDAATHAG